MPDSIEDYYLTPWDIGYGRIVKFDHEFIGREALEQMASETARKKVTLALDTEDVMRVIGSQFAEGRSRQVHGVPVARSTRCTPTTRS